MKKTNFELACEKIGVAPVLPPVEGLIPGAAKRMIAGYQLDIIEQATNDGWLPDFGNRSQEKWTAFMVWSPASGCFVLYGTGYTSTDSSLGARFWFPDSPTARKFFTENADLINVLHSIG